MKYLIDIPGTEEASSQGAREIAELLTRGGFRKVFYEAKNFTVSPFGVHAQRSDDPPRKLSVSDMHKGPSFANTVASIEVFLNGEPQIAVFRYDADAGEIERYVTDDSGLVFEGDEIKREIVHGTVEVRWK